MCNTCTGDDRDERCGLDLVVPPFPETDAVGFAEVLGFSRAVGRAVRGDAFPELWGGEGVLCISYGFVGFIGFMDC